MIFRRILTLFGTFFLLDWLSKAKVDGDGQLPTGRVTVEQLKETGEMCEKEGGINDSWIEQFKKGCRRLYDQETGDSQFKWELKKGSPDLFHLYIERVQKPFYFRTVIIGAWTGAMKYIGTFTTGRLTTDEGCELQSKYQMRSKFDTDTCLPGDGEVLYWRNTFGTEVWRLDRVMFNFQLKRHDYEALGLINNTTTTVDPNKSRFYFIAYIAGDKDCYTGRRSPVFALPVGDGSGPIECNYGNMVVQKPVLESPYDKETGLPLFLSNRWIPTTTLQTTKKTTTTTKTTSSTTTEPTTKETTTVTSTTKITTIASTSLSTSSTSTTLSTSSSLNPSTSLATSSSSPSSTTEPITTTPVKTPAKTTSEVTTTPQETEKSTTVTTDSSKSQTKPVTTAKVTTTTITTEKLTSTPTQTPTKTTTRLPVIPPIPTPVDFKNITLKPVRPGNIVPVRPPPISDDNENVKEEGTKSTENKPPISVPEMYDGCGKKKGCIGDPDQCIPHKSCQSIISYGEDETKVRLQIMGKSGKYIAIGLSRDQKMGNDSVVECVRGYGDQIFAYMSWNYRRDNKREKDHSVISNVKGSYVDGFIICEFWRLRQSHYQKENFDLDKEKFFVLHARGNTATDGDKGNIGYHDEGASFTKTKYRLNERFSKRKYRLILENVHSSLLIGAWIFCFPVSIFISRYYKETYMNRGICGYTIWYSWHTILTWLGSVMTILAVAGVCIGSETFIGMGQKGWHPHNITGVTLLLIILLEIITGYVVRGLNYRRSCQLCNYIHGFLGHSSFFVAFANIYESTGFESGLPCSLAPALVSWIVMYLLIHLIMSYQVCYVDFIRGSHMSRAYNCFKIKSIPHPHNEDVPGSPIRKLFLGIFVTFSILFTSGLIVVNLLSSSEEICGKGKAVKNETTLNDASKRDQF